MRAKNIIKMGSVLILSATLISTNGFAAKAVPVSWSVEPIHYTAGARKKFALSNTEVFNGSLTEKEVDRILKDPEHRLSPEFRVPKEIQTKVRFWFLVYAMYNRNHVMIHDSRHKDVIYEVLDFTEAAKQGSRKYRAIKSKKTREVLGAYRKAFSDLENNPNPKNPTREQQIILSKLGKIDNRKSFRAHRRFLRTQTGLRDSVVQGLIASDEYLPRMERIFAKLGVPTELTRLCLVESSFNTRAVSKVGATGVWQFLERSGEKYLYIDQGLKVDERISPLKSTLAAARLLKRNKKLLGAWPLAIISYNSGLKKFFRMKRRNVDLSNLGQLLALNNKKSILGYAGKNYYAEFLAMLHADIYRDHIFGNQLGPVLTRQSIQYVELKDNQSAIEFVIEAGVNLKDFQRLNPDIMDLKVKLPAGILLAMPIKADKDNFSSLFEFSVDKLAMN